MIHAGQHAGWHCAQWWGGLQHLLPPALISKPQEAGLQQRKQAKAHWLIGELLCLAAAILSTRSGHRMVIPLVIRCWSYHWSYCVGHIGLDKLLCLAAASPM
eukprot:1158556-Pelagomonas_calceolata.AAC.10